MVKSASYPNSSSELIYLTQKNPTVCDTDRGVFLTNLLLGFPKKEKREVRLYYVYMCVCICVYVRVYILLN
jgi:hypothetical protein